jgi:hypothetical protein
MSAATVTPQDQIRGLLTAIDTILTSSPNNQMEMYENDAQIALKYGAIAEIATAQAEVHRAAEENTFMARGGGRRRKTRRNRRHTRH